MREKGICGIMLAGVHRWDNSGFDELLPRALMPVGHLPLIGHILGWLRDAGIADVTICANSDSRQLRQTLTERASPGIELDYYEDWTPRGPAGCIRDAASQAAAERFVVVEGTILPECDLRAVLEEHARSNAAMTIVAARDPDNMNGSETRLVPVGIYVLDRSVLEHIPETGYQDVKEVLLPRLHEQGMHVRTHTLPMPCPRVTDATSYLAVNAWVLERLMRDSRTLPGYRRIGRSIVHESARVSSPDGLVGTVLIGPGTTIAPGATLVGPTTIGAQCVIERGAVVCNSVLWDGCWIERGAAVNNCVLGDAVHVEAETILLHTTLAAEPDRHRQLPSASCLESSMFPALPDDASTRPPKEDEVQPTAVPAVRSSDAAPAQAVSL